MSVAFLCDRPSKSYYTFSAFKILKNSMGNFHLGPLNFELLKLQKNHAHYLEFWFWMSLDFFVASGIRELFASKVQPNFLICILQIMLVNLPWQSQWEGERHLFGHKFVSEKFIINVTHHYLVLFAAIDFSKRLSDICPQTQYAVILTN